jgi:hypothetical protein
MDFKKRMNASRTIIVVSPYWWPPLWSSGQSFRLQIQRSRVRFPALPEVGGLKWGPLSLVRTTEEPLENKKQRLRSRKPSGNSLRWPRNTLYPQRLPLTSPTSGGRSVGIVRLRTTATEFSYFLYMNWVRSKAEIRSEEVALKFPTGENYNQSSSC